MLTLCGIGAVSGCVIPISNSADDRRSGEAESTDEAAESDEPEPMWENVVGGDYAINAPAVTDGPVVFQSDTRVYALSQRTGEVVWIVDIDSAPNYFSPAFDAGRVFAAGDGSFREGRTGTLTAIDAESGEQVWRLHNDIGDTPTAANGTVYFGDDPRNAPGTIRAVDQQDGDERWSFEITDGRHSSVPYGPAEADGTVYIGANLQNADDGRYGGLYALDAEDGTREWRRTIDDTIETSSVVDDGTVYLGASDGGSIHAFDAATGEGEWSYTKPTGDSNYWVTPAVADGTLFAGNVGGVIAIDAASGDLEWDLRHNRVSGNGVVAAGGTVYSAGQSLFALSPSDGSVEWALERLNLSSTAFSPQRSWTGSCTLGAVSRRTRRIPTSTSSSRCQPTTDSCDPRSQLVAAERSGCTTDGSSAQSSC